MAWVGRLVGWHLLAEMGGDMSVFPDAAHCASWAGLSPGSEESAGVQRSGRTKKGNRYLRRILTQAAWANSHCKDGYLRALFFRIKARRGWAKAIIAVAHKLIVIAYSILKFRTPYRELGGDYFDRLNPERTARRLVARMEQMGFQVEVTRRPAPVPAPEPTAVAPAERPAKRKRGRPPKQPAAGFLSSEESL